MKIVLITGGILIGIIASLIFVMSKTHNPSPSMRGNGDTLNVFGTPEPKIFAPEAGEYEFTYPGDFVVTSFTQTDEETKTEYITTTFQGKNIENSFELSTSLYTLKNNPTVAQVQKDNPSMLMEDATDISIASARGVAFLDVSSPAHPIRNIWFVAHGILYQISTYKSFDEGIAKVLESWVWTGEGKKNNE